MGAPAQIQETMGDADIELELLKAEEEQLHREIRQLELDEKMADFEKKIADQRQLVEQWRDCYKVDDADMWEWDECKPSKSEKEVMFKAIVNANKMIEDMEDKLTEIRLSREMADA